MLGTSPSTTHVQGSLLQNCYPVSRFFYELSSQFGAEVNEASGVEAALETVTWSRGQVSVYKDSGSMNGWKK